MKSLVIALGALALSFALTVIAAAQEATRQDAANEAAPNPAQTTAPEKAQPRLGPAEAPTDEDRITFPPTLPLPLAEAKKRYLDTQKRLQDLVKDGSLEPLGVLVMKASNDFEIRDERRDRLRVVAAEAFDARRQLQQAELADLEARVARIKRALEIRDAMRDTLIEQRTDELLEQMEDGAQKGNRGASAASGDGDPQSPAIKNSAVPPRVFEKDINLHAERLKSAVEDARATFALAKRTHERALKRFKSGAISKEVLDQFQGELERAQNWLDRSTLSWDVFREAYPDLPDESEQSPAGEGAAGGQAKTKTGTELELIDAEIELQDANANLATAKNLYEYSKKMHAKGYITGLDVETKSLELERAKLQLERAKTRLKVLGRSPAGENAVEDTEKAAFDQTEIAAPPIVWGPKDNDQLPAREGAAMGSLQFGLRLEPTKAVYVPGEVVTATFFLNYARNGTEESKVPRSDVLEALGIDLVLRGTHRQLDWQWGPAHEGLAQLGENAVAFAGRGLAISSSEDCHRECRNGSQNQPRFGDIGVS